VLGSVTDVGAAVSKAFERCNAFSEAGAAGQRGEILASPATAASKIAVSMMNDAVNAIFLVTALFLSYHQSMKMRVAATAGGVEL